MSNGEMEGTCLQALCNSRVAGQKVAEGFITGGKHGELLVAAERSEQPRILDEGVERLEADAPQKVSQPR